MERSCEIFWGSLAMTSGPNFLYIGTSKAGSTWIFKVLSWHPQIYMYPGKDIAFFTSNFDQGWEWYLKNFTPENDRQLVGEVSHTYMISGEARTRIHELLPDAKLIVCLREPVERTYSQYLDGIKNGKLHGTFEEELERTSSLIDRSRYGTHIAAYLEKLPRRQLYIANFDQLRAAPTEFAADLFRFLEVEPLEIPAKMHQKVLPAAEPRIRSLALAAKAVARRANRMGFAALKGKAKNSPILRNLLYKPYTENSRPTMALETETRLRQLMADEVRSLDAVAGTDFCRLWKYPTE